MQRQISVLTLNLCRDDAKIKKPRTMPCINETFLGVRNSFFKKGSGRRRQNENI